MLSHLWGKAHDWMKDYAGLSKTDKELAKRYLNGQQKQADNSVVEEWVPLGETSGN